MSESGCDGCSRRALIRGIAVGAAGVVIAACGGGDDAVLPVDGGGGSGVDAGVSAVSMCGTDLCIDLTNPRAANLTKMNGQLVVAAPDDRIIIVRTSDTTFAVLSDVCTHRGCSVSFNATMQLLTCPCHGARYKLTGAVTQGPATRALLVYKSTFDATTQILTIVV